MPIVAPSILGADFTHLGSVIEMINQSEADWIHCDVMDGRFVPNISFGFPIIEAVKKVAQKPLDVHLMIEEPERYLSDFQQAGADLLTIHAEATRHLDRSVNAIREAGMQVGVALNPATSVEAVQHVLPLVDVVLLMSVNPGFGGQSFIPYVLEKVRLLRQMIALSGSGCHIEIDGGIDAQTAPQAVQAGVDVLVAGSYVFKAQDPTAIIGELKGLGPIQREA